MAKKKPPVKKSPTKKPPTKKRTTRSTEETYAAPPIVSNGARITLDPHPNNPIFDRSLDQSITGSVSDNNVSGLAGEVKRRGLRVIPVVIIPGFVTGTFVVTIPARSLPNAYDDYILKVTRTGALPASMVLDCVG